MKEKTQITDALEKLGLSENESALYALMLRYPGSTIKELQVRSPFPRTMLYHVLGQLEERGLVRSRKSGSKMIFTATSPERLYDILSERERGFEKTMNVVRSVIPDLKNRYRIANNRPGVRIFEGPEEYKKALEDMLVSNPKVLYAYYNMTKDTKPGTEVRHKAEKRRITKKIMKKVLLFESPIVKKKLKRYKYNDVTQYRLLPKELDAFGVNLHIYDGKLLYTIYVDKDPMAITIEDQMLYQMHKSMFEYFWSGGKDITLWAIEGNTKKK